MLKMYIKDMKVLLADRKELMTFILMPIVLTTILTFALANAFEMSGPTHALKIGVVKDYDAFEEASALQELLGEIPVDLDVEAIFFESFLNSEEVQKIMQYEILTEEEGRAALDDQSIMGLLILPEGFIVDQTLNFINSEMNSIDLLFIQHPDYTVSGPIAHSILSSYFNHLNEMWVDQAVYYDQAYAVLEEAVFYQGLAGVFDIRNQSPSMTVTSSVVEGRRLINSATYYAIGMMAMFVLYGSAHCGRGLLQEKKMLTLNRNYVGGQRYVSILASKTLMGFSLSLIQMVILLAFSKWVLGVNWTNLSMLFISLLFSALAIAGLGSLLGALTLNSDDFKVVNVFENIIVHIFALLGGSFIPVETLPGFARVIQGYIPNGVILRLFTDVYQEAPLSMLGEHWFKLILFGVVCYIVAYFITKRKEVLTYAGINEVEA